MTKYFDKVFLFVMTLLMGFLVISLGVFVFKIATGDFDEKNKRVSCYKFVAPQKRTFFITPGWKVYGYHNGYVLTCGPHENLSINRD